MVLKGRVLNSFKESETPYYWIILRGASLNCTDRKFLTSNCHFVFLFIIVMPGSSDYYNGHSLILDLVDKPMFLAYPSGI